MKKIVNVTLFSTVLLLFAACSSDSKATNHTSSKEETQSSVMDKASKSSSDIKTETLQLGQSFEFDNNEEITIESVTKDDSFILENPIDDQFPVIVKAKIKNNSDSPINTTFQDFYLFDSNNEKATFDSISYSDQIDDITHEIGPNSTLTLSINFSSAGNAPYTVKYGNITWKE